MTTNARPKYVLVKGFAGLGNRLFAVLTGALYARLTGRRLLVDWSDATYSDDGANVFGRLFIDHAGHAAELPPDTDSVAPWMWRGRLGTSARDMLLAHAPQSHRDPFAGLLFSFDLSRLDHEEDVLVFWSYVPLIDRLRRHFHGDLAGWRRLDDDAILRLLMHETLTPHPAVVERVAALQRGWRVPPLIGVHARHTDRRTNLRRLKRRLDASLARHPGAGVFLATDNAAVEQDFIRAYPGIVTQPKWFPDQGRLHACESCPDRAINAVEALIDLFVLAGCRHQIINGSSSLGRLGTIVGSPPPAEVADVRAGRWVPSWLHEAAWRTHADVRWGANRRRLGTPLRRPSAAS